MRNTFIEELMRLSLSSVIRTIVRVGGDPHHVSLRLCSNEVVPIFAFFKLSTLFRLNTLVEATAYDSPQNLVARFTLVYFLLSIEYNFRLIVKLPLLPQWLPSSLVHIYPNSSWSEREIRDMFGIFFTGNTDLRRLLTDYGFEGFPLRKDFPLTGYLEARYDDENQRILYEPVELSQEFRVFTLGSPWEAYTD